MAGLLATKTPRTLPDGLSSSFSSLKSSNQGLFAEELARRQSDINASGVDSVISGMQKEASDWYTRNQDTGMKPVGSGWIQEYWNTSGLTKPPATTTGSTTTGSSSSGGAAPPTSGNQNMTTAQSPGGFTGDWSKSGLLTPAQNVQPITRQVTPDELASYQLEKLTGGDSLMKQRAETAGAQYANKRGLLNSGQAGAAAFGEFVDRATPLAAADANRYGTVADKNMDAQNTFGLADKQFGFESQLQSNDFGFKSGENALDRSLTKSESAADRASRESLQSSADAAALARQNLAQGFTGGENALDRAANSAEAQAGRDFTSGENQLNRDANTAATMQAAEIAADAALTQHLYGLEELGYRFNLDSYNVSKTYAAGIMGNLQNNISTILADPNLDQASKDNAVNNLVIQTNDMLKFGSDLYSSNLPTYGEAGSGGNQAPVPQAPSVVVTSLYQKLLGRQPEPEGLRFWSDVMYKNNLTPEQLEQRMMQSQGYLQHVAQSVASA